MRKVNMLFLLLLCACSHKTDFSSMTELQDYSNDPSHGFIQKHTEKGMVVSVKVEPRLSSKEDLVMKIRLGMEDGSSFLKSQRASQAVLENYLSFEIAKDFTLQAAGHSFRPSFSHYERNYGLKPDIDILLTFQQVPVNTPLELFFTDNQLGLSHSSFHFDQSTNNICHVI